MFRILGGPTTAANIGHKMLPDTEGRLPDDAKHRGVPWDATGRQPVMRHQDPMTAHRHRRRQMLTNHETPGHHYE